MVEKSAPRTGLLSVTQNHVLLRDLLLIPLTANGVNGDNAVPHADKAWIFSVLEIKAVAKGPIL